MADMTSATGARAAEPALQACIVRLSSSEAGQVEADVIPNLCR